VKSIKELSISGLIGLRQLWARRVREIERRLKAVQRQVFTAERARARALDHLNRVIEEERRRRCEIR
jgi:hypothetical protein